MAEQREWTGVADMDGDEIAVDDLVEVAGHIGRVRWWAGAYGLEIAGYTDEAHGTIDWDRMCEEIPFRNSDRFCHEDNFVTLYELWVNLNKAQDDTMILESAKIVGRYKE